MEHHSALVCTRRRYTLHLHRVGTYDVVFSLVPAWYRYPWMFMIAAAAAASNSVYLWCILPDLVCGTNVCQAMEISWHRGLNNAGIETAFVVKHDASLHCCFKNTRINERVTASLPSGFLSGDSFWLDKCWMANVWIQSSSSMCLETLGIQNSFSP